jgi:hypothetical protein
VNPFDLPFKEIQTATDHSPIVAMFDGIGVRTVGEERIRNFKPAKTPTSLGTTMDSQRESFILVPV